MNIHTIISNNSLENNSYIVYDEFKNGIIIDPSFNSAKIIDYVTSNNIKINYIILTHSHTDHVFDTNLVKGLDGVIVGHSMLKKNINDSSINLSYMFNLTLDKINLDILINDGDTLPFGNNTLKFIYTKGHTNDSICVLINNWLFTGDTIFKSDMGRTDFKTGSHYELIESIKNKILPLEDNIIIYPGHGPTTTILNEKILY